MLESFTFHHIGIATPSIEKTASYYLSAGYSMSEATIDPIQNVRITFLNKDGMPTIELLEAINNESPVVSIISKMGGAAPYHCCYSVPNINDAIIELKKQRFLQLSKPVNAIAINNQLVCFMYNKFVGLIELVEEQAAPTCFNTKLKTTHQL